MTIYEIIQYIPAQLPGMGDNFTLSISVLNPSLWAERLQVGDLDRVYNSDDPRNNRRIRIVHVIGENSDLALARAFQILFPNTVVTNARPV